MLFVPFCGVPASAFSSFPNHLSTFINCTDASLSSAVASTFRISSSSFISYLFLLSMYSARCPFISTFSKLVLFPVFSIISVYSFVVPSSPLTLIFISVSFPIIVSCLIVSCISYSPISIFTSAFSSSVVAFISIVSFWLANL